ncbi:hypothetical protein [Amycolatopsis sp. NPDC058986]|uniref:hypothetical protein n=1 Tax=unclassified Amycolatopsis TaxID=2618356 RepID=UPI00366B0A6B
MAWLSLTNEFPGSDESAREGRIPAANVPDGLPTVLWTRIGTEQQEQALDRETLADLIREGIEESLRRRRSAAQTTWFDAATAADLLLQHVQNLTSGEAE